MKLKTILIVNRNAGNKTAGKNWKEIFLKLRRSTPEIELEFTSHRNHAISITKKAVEEGCRKVIILGGDGTLNEAANGILLQKKVPPTHVLLGLIPIGSGDDWCRTFNVPTDTSEAIDIIKNERTFLQDIGKVTYSHDGKRVSRYFINVAGMGFDAMVAHKVNRDKDKHQTTKTVYFKNLITSLIESQSQPYKIIIDDKKIKEDIFSMCVGIGKYNGGGMMQLPNAIPDDGVFDITLIKSISKTDVIKNVKNLYDGSFISHPSAALMKGKEISIEAPKKVYLEADGESLGNPPYEFEILPRSLCVIV